MPNTVRLHRVLATKPDKVYRAFIEADAMAKWLPPNGFACTVHHLDAKVACQTCHGEVAQREVLFQEKPITMHACMRCHSETGAPNDCELCHDTH